MPKFILNINSKNTQAEYNSSLIYSTDMESMVEENLKPLLEIEFLTAKVETDEFYTKYSFNVTKQKEAELMQVLQKILNKSIISENPTSLN